MTRITYYHILGVSSDASEDEIAGAFRRKVKEWHPDVCRHPDAEERMREINEAAEVLCDPERRLRYDRALAGKIPFEQVMAARPGPVKKSGWQGFWTFSGHGRSAGHGGPGSLHSGIRFAVTGVAALLILGILIFAAISALPLLSGPSPAWMAGHGDATGLTVPAEDDTGSSMEQGDERLVAGDYEGALSAYNAIIAGNPSVTERDLWYNRGLAQYALGRYADAAESFDRVLRADPDDPLALAQKGASLVGLGRYEESLEYTDRAISGGFDSAWIWNNRGLALAGLGQQKEALLAFENAGIFSGRQDSILYRNVVVQPAYVTGF